MKKCWMSLALGVVFSCFSHGAVAQDPVTIRFDNGGDEAGVTPPGTTSFSFMGSNWSGGQVATEAILPLYASGSFSYEIEGMGGEVGRRCRHQVRLLYRPAGRRQGAVVRAGLSGQCPHHRRSRRPRERGLDPHPPSPRHPAEP